MQLKSGCGSVKCECMNDGYRYYMNDTLMQLNSGWYMNSHATAFTSNALSNNTKQQAPIVT